MVNKTEHHRARKTPNNQWSLREKLCLASAIVRVGGRNWKIVSEMLSSFAEPNRPSDWFSPKNCAVQYASLLKSVTTSKSKKRMPGTKNLAQRIINKLTEERKLELQKKMEEERSEYYKLREELEAIQSGAASDEQIEKWCAELDEENKRKEEDAVALAQWLRLREERKLEEGIGVTAVRNPTAVHNRKRKTAKSLGVSVTESSATIPNVVRDNQPLSHNLQPLVSTDIIQESGAAADEQIEKWCVELDEENKRKKEDAVALGQWLRLREERKLEEGIGVTAVRNPTAAHKRKRKTAESLGVSVTESSATIPKVVRDNQPMSPLVSTDIIQESTAVLTSTSIESGILYLDDMPVSLTLQQLMSADIEQPMLTLSPTSSVPGILPDSVPLSSSVKHLVGTGIIKELTPASAPTSNAPGAMPLNSVPLSSSLQQLVSTDILQKPTPILAPTSSVPGFKSFDDVPLSPSLQDLVSTDSVSLDSEQLLTSLQQLVSTDISQEATLAQAPTSSESLYIEHLSPSLQQLVTTAIIHKSPSPRASTSSESVDSEPLSPSLQQLVTTEIIQEATAHLTLISSVSVDSVPLSPSLQQLVTTEIIQESRAPLVPTPSVSVDSEPSVLSLQQLETTTIIEESTPGSSVSLESESSSSNLTPSSSMPLASSETSFLASLLNINTTTVPTKEDKEERLKQKPVHEFLLETSKNIVEVIHDEVKEEEIIESEQEISKVVTAEPKEEIITVKDAEIVAKKTEKVEEDINNVDNKGESNETEMSANDKSVILNESISTNDEQSKQDDSKSINVEKNVLIPVDIPVNGKAVAPGSAVILEVIVIDDDDDDSDKDMNESMPELQEEINQVKNEEVEFEEKPEIDIEVSGYIPEVSKSFYDDMSTEVTKQQKVKRDYTRKEKKQNLSTAKTGKEKNTERSDKTKEYEESSENPPGSLDDDPDYRLWKKSVMQVYHRLAAHKYAYLFLNTAEEAPGSHNKIYRPINLQTIRNKIENNEFQTTVEFHQDLMIMFQNAVMSNDYKISVFRMTKQMQSESEQEMKFLHSIESSRRRQTRSSVAGFKCEN